MSEASFTPGPWKAIPQGGSSTVIANLSPPRNDTRIPAYGYDNSNGFCIGYPFLGEDVREVRPDFVCFSHADAHLIAAAPDLYAGLKRAIGAIRDAEKDTNWISGDPWGESLADDLERILAKASGEQGQ